MVPNISHLPASPGSSRRVSQQAATQMVARGQQLDETSEANGADQSLLEEKFNQFVGQTFYGTMLKAMRETVGKPAYLHGGRGEEVFQAQFDQTLSEHLSEATAEQFAKPMFELFTLQRR